MKQKNIDTKKIESRANHVVNSEKIGCHKEFEGTRNYYYNYGLTIGCLWNI